jgi:L-fucose isomerase
LSIKVALAHVTDSRLAIFSKREPAVKEEIQSLKWLGKEYKVIESDVLNSINDIESFAEKANIFGVQSLIIHVPIWADPIFSIKLHNHIPVPVLLLGNSRPDTSSLVGVLGAGGALDQVGCQHFRVFEHSSEKSLKMIHSFIRACGTIQSLKGQTLGLFGGKSLGIFTANVDPAQWQKLFGVDIEILDQHDIISEAENISLEHVEQEKMWLTKNLGNVAFSGVFTSSTFEKQIRSYLATKILVNKNNLDFVGVKCQPELSDGYVTQCIAHMLMNNRFDSNGKKEAIIHACESDADGALTMQILHLLSEGKSASLVDVRWFDEKEKTWTLANCGAIACEFFATDADPIGLKQLEATQHVFGKGGGGAYPGVVAPGKVTLARLCRNNGVYWMAIILGDVESRKRSDLAKTTASFPQAFVRTNAGIDFAEVYGSNHIHMVKGDFTEELIIFCKLIGIDWRIWN